jgi:uncharacterized delta-60 repeat protein
MRMRARTWGTAAATALALLLALAPPAGAAPLRGQLDPSFGHGGRVLFGHGPSFAKADYDAVALQPDGAAVFAGHTEAIRGKYVERAVLIQRRLPDGHLDPSFHQVADSGAGFGSTGLALQPDGDVLYTTVGESYTGAVKRLLPNGLPDTAFGKEGTADLPLDPSYLAVDPEGRIIVAGGAPVGGDCHDCEPKPVVAVARLNPDGTLDRSFGTEGMLIVSAPHDVFGDATGLALEPDGSIVLSSGGGKLFGVTAAGATNLAFGEAGLVVAGPGFGTMTESASGDLITATTSAKSCCRLRGQFVLHAYRADGSLDPAWGSGGTLTIRAGDVVEPVALAPGADGSVTLLGETAKATGANGCKKCEFRPYLARVTSAGVVDPAFSSDLGGAIDEGSVAVAGIAVAPSGAVVAAGTTTPRGEGERATAVGLTPRGSLDPAYGTGGFAGKREPLPSNTAALGFAAGPGGKLVTAYESNTGSSSGKLSIGAWSANGKRLHGYGGKSQLVYSRPGLTLSADGRGRLYRIEGSSDSVRRIDTDGRLERRYGSDGMAPLPEGFDASRLAVRRDGTVLVVGRLAGEDEMTLYELSPDGRPNRSFGNRGLVRIRSPKGIKARALAATFDRRGRILVFGTVEDQTLLIRLLANGKPDPSFGEHGRVNFRPLLSTAITSINATRDGRIYLVTSSSGGRETTLVRFREDGALDRSFGRGGVVRYGASQPLLAFFPGPRQLVLVAGDGDAFRTGLTLRAFHLDGSPDRSFGDDGVFRGSPGPLGAFGPIGAVRQPDGKIVIAGTVRPNNYGEKLELIRFR